MPPPCFRIAGDHRAHHRSVNVLIRGHSEHLSSKEMPVREPSTLTVHDVPQVRQLLMLEFAGLPIAKAALKFAQGSGGKWPDLRVAEEPVAVT